MTHTCRTCCLALLGVLTIAACADDQRTETQSSLLIANVSIVDGSGQPPFAGSVRIVDGLIHEVGELERRPGEEMFRGQGLVLSPGFIDTHSHADSDIFGHPDALAAVSQGITTVIVGQDGRSPFPLSEFAERLSKSGTAVNFAAYAGHNTLRNLILGDDFRRTANDDELEAMRELLGGELEAGALGLSTGLEYEPGIHADTDEVLSLAQTAARQGGRYLSHLRSEDRWLIEAIDEIIEIGRVTEMPVQISHMKLAMKSLWGRAPEILQKLEDARARGIDITADVYPYEYWQSTMMVLLPERDPTDREAIGFALDELSPPDGIWFTRFDAQPEYVGMKLADIAAMRETDAVTTFSELALAAAAYAEEHDVRAEAIIGTSMHAEDIRTLLAWEHSNVATDGGLDDLHPRAYGSFTRVLARYVRDDGALSLPTAVRKMTGLAAEHMGLRDRGYVRVGQAADLVLFDPNTVTDHATPDKPKQLSQGIFAVWVGGSLVFSEGRSTGERPGQFLRRADLSL